MSNLVAIAWDGDGIGSLVGRAVLRDDPAEVSRLSHGIERGNQVFVAWVSEHRGSIVSCGGDEGCAFVPADRVGDLPDIMRHYEGATGAPVSVGVGVKMSEAAKALLVAKHHGGDQVLVYDEGVEEQLREIQPPTEDEKQREHYGPALGKAEPLEKMALIHSSAKKPKTVYRVQDANGEGPYGGGATAQVEDIHQGRGARVGDPGFDTPPPEEDFEPKEFGHSFGGSYLYGFEHPQHAVNWFGHGGLQKLYAAGYRLKEMPASRVYRSGSGKQVLFRPHNTFDTSLAPDAQGVDHSAYEPETDEPEEPAPAPQAPGTVGGKKTRIKKAEPAVVRDDPANQGGPATPAPELDPARSPVFSPDPAGVVTAQPPADAAVPPLGEPTLPISVADAAPQQAPIPAMAAPSLQDRVRQAVDLQARVEAAALERDGTAADEVRARMAEILTRVGGKREDLQALVQHAPGVADALTELLAVVRDLARTQPRPSTVQPAKKAEGDAPAPHREARGGGEAGREHVVRPVGAIKDGRVKVRLNSGGEGWRSVRSGMVETPDGQPASAKEPNTATGALQEG